MKRRLLTTRAGSGHYATGADRWLVSYADYMTLAFALFVVLYALNANKTELQQPLLDGMEQAFVRLSGEAKPAPAANSMVSEVDEQEKTGTGNPLTDNDTSLAKLKSDLELRLGPLLEKNMLILEQEGDWLTLSFDGRLVFASGSALLSGNADTILNAALPALTEVNHFIRVRGYADNLAVSNELYGSNWHLSAERARVVLEWLENHGIAAARLSLEAFGEFRPQDEGALTNTGRANANRANSRRVEISIAKQVLTTPTSLPSRPLAAEQQSDLRVYELPNGGIRIGTSATQDGVTQ